jgi:hypothetical protein
MGRTETSNTNQVSLEIEGTPQSSEVWVQPDTNTPGHTEIYFGYRSDNSDDGTALYDITTGHLLVPEDEFPWHMNSVDP